MVKPLQAERWWKGKKMGQWGATASFSTPSELERMLNIKRGDHVDICLNKDYSYTVYPPKYYALQKAVKKALEEEATITDDDWEQSMKELGLRD